ncbi:MAG: hypothetical protein ACJA1C_000904 [Crocinitomicaceae bacterium]
MNDLNSTGETSKINRMKYLSVLCFISVLISCSSQESTDPDSETPKALEDSAEVIPEVDPTLIDSTSLGLNFTPNGTYNATKSEVKRLRSTKNSGKDLEDYLLNKIIPHWYGTPWDFNGYTAIPNQGVIACGYFVSTTLLHAGININRYHLAQQGGTNEAKSLALNDENMRTMWGYDSLQTVMKRDYEDGLYFVGLDHHVGYLYMKDKVLYFIHSNYIDDKVMLEKAEYSAAFQSNIYVIAEISTNEELLEKWRKGEAFMVVRN